MVVFTTGIGLEHGGVWSGDPVPRRQKSEKFPALLDEAARPFAGMALPDPRIDPSPLPPSVVSEAQLVNEIHGVVVELVAASAAPPPRPEPIDLRWVARLPASTLRHLAAIADHYDRREFKDPERAAEELAEMLAKGARPALGWYRRHMVPQVWPPTYQPPPRSDGPALGD